MALLFVESSLFLQWVNIAHRSITDKSERGKMKKSLLFSLNYPPTIPSQQATEWAPAHLNLQCLQEKSNKASLSELGEKNHSWHDGKMSKNSFVFHSSSEKGARWWNGSSAKNEYEKKLKQFYSASPAAKTMTTTTSTLFFIEKIMLSFVILPWQHFSLFAPIVVVSHIISPPPLWRVFAHWNNETMKAKNCLAFNAPLWSDFEAVMQSLNLNITIWPDFMLSQIWS